MSRLFVERGERQGLAPRLWAELGKALRVLKARGNGRRGDDKDVRPLFRPAGRVLSAADEVFHARADALRRRAVPLLGVVRAEHEDEQVHGLVAHEAGPDVACARDAIAEGVLEYRCASVQALFDYKILLSERRLHQPRPAGGLGKAHGAAGLRNTVEVGGVAAVAVRVGVAEADDVLPVHLISGREAAAADWPTRRNFSSGREGKMLPAISGYSSARTALQVESTRSPPLPDMTRPSSRTCLNS